MEILLVCFAKDKDFSQFAILSAQNAQLKPHWTFFCGESSRIIPQFVRELCFQIDMHVLFLSYITIFAEAENFLFFPIELIEERQRIFSFCVFVSLPVPHSHHLPFLKDTNTSQRRVEDFRRILAVAKLVLYRNGCGEPRNRNRRSVHASICSRIRLPMHVKWQTLRTEAKEAFGSVPNTRLIFRKPL